MRARGQGTILIDFATDPAADSGGGPGVNRLCAAAIRSSWSTSETAEGADLRVRSFGWNAPPSPRRMFIDHGSFADAGFWTYTAPGLLVGDTILVASTVCVEVAARFIRSPGPPVLRVPFAIEVDRFQPAADRREARAALRERHGVPADGPLLLVASGFVRRKNQHLAVLFHRALLELVPDARLAFAGGPSGSATSEEYHAAVRRLATRAGAEDRVHFLGPVRHHSLPDVMAASDLLVHLTNCRLENFGLVVGEAMACGLPVVAADWGGLRDLVIPGETGILAATYLSDNGPRTDWRSAVAPAAEILGDAVVWDRMSRRSRCLAERSLGFEAYGERLENAIRTALDGKTGADERLALTPEATEMMFRTIHLNATHPEIKGTGDEYRLLMPLDAGRHYRWLTGPAATRERAPEITSKDSLYGVVAWSDEAGAIRVTDEAWPASLAADALEIEVARRCQGTRSVEDIIGSLSIAGDRRAAVVRAAQSLVDRGVLCPLRPLEDDARLRARAGAILRDDPARLS